MSSRSRDPGSRGSSWQEAEVSGSALTGGHNTPTPQGGLCPRTVLCLSFPSHAPSRAEPCPARSQHRVNSWDVRLCRTPTPCTAPTSEPCPPKALTSCSPSAAGSEPRAPWPRTGGRPAAGTPPPCPAPAPGAVARPPCPGHTWGQGRAQHSLGSGPQGPPRSLSQSRGDFFIHSPHPCIPLTRPIHRSIHASEHPAHNFYHPLSPLWHPGTHLPGW